MAAQLPMPGAPVQRIARPPVRVRVTGDLEGGDEVDALAGLGVGARGRRAVRDHHCRAVVLQHRRQCADRWLVAGDHRDEAGDVVGGEVKAHGIVHDLTPDQGKPHPSRAVELAVGDPDRERRRDEPHRQVVPEHPLGERRMDGLDFLHDAQVALAVAEVADDSPDRIVDLGRWLPEVARGSDPLHVAAGIV
jgi:hypothetical protein